jgi:hypothetical protein
VGDAAKLSGKPLMGFLAGKAITKDPGAAKKLFQGSLAHGFGIVITSGRGMSLGNSRVPPLGPYASSATRGQRGPAKGPVMMLRTRPMMSFY